MPEDLFSSEKKQIAFSSVQAGDDDDMDMTPMVDVTFLLLIFFMLTLKIVQPEGDKPTDHRPEEIQDPNVVKINSIGRDDEEGENAANHRADQPDTESIK